MCPYSYSYSIFVFDNDTRVRGDNDGAHTAMADRGKPRKTKKGGLLPGSVWYTVSGAKHHLITSFQGPYPCYGRAGKAFCFT